MGQLAPNAQEHAGVFLFQLCTSLGDAINLSQKFSLVRRIGRDQRLHDGFFLLNRGELVNQFEPAGIENVIHLLLLIVGQTEFLDELGIVPPASWRAEAQTAARPSRTTHTAAARVARAWLRRTVRTARGGLLSKTSHSQQEHQERRYGNS